MYGSTYSTSLSLQDKGHAENHRTTLYNKHLCDTQHAGKQIPLSANGTVLLQAC